MLLYAYTSKQILHSNHDRHRRGNLLKPFYIATIANQPKFLFYIN